MNTADIVLSRCLSMDLEVSPRDGHIHALAGVRADSGRSVTWTLKASGDDQTDGRVTCLDGDDVASVKDRCSVDEALAALDGLAEVLTSWSVTTSSSSTFPICKLSLPGWGCCGCPL